eukprot:scaffold167_cov110-Cylindrotheca_fusiformis.AAC.20
MLMRVLLPRSKLAIRSILHIVQSRTATASNYTTTTTTMRQPPSSAPLTLLAADFCPFANRGIIALLEKEADPLNPTNFDLQHVCYQMGPEKDPGTKWLYSLDQKTVPVLIDKSKDDKVIGESMDVVEYVDSLFPDIHPLQPSDPDMKEKMKTYIDRHGSIIGPVYKLLMAQDKDEQKQLADDLLKELTTFDKSLQELEGPYLCGDQFTMADVQMFPFMERLIIFLGHYRQFVIPDELEHLHRWYNTILERPAVQKTTADRDETSMNTYCFVEQDRKKYLIEVYEAYANNEIDFAKKLSKESGAPGVNPYAEYKKKQREEEKKEEE